MSERRVTIPEVHRIEMGARVRRELMEASRRRSDEARKKGVHRVDRMETVKHELYQLYGIPPQILNQYLGGHRQIPLQDIRALSQYTGISIEALIQDAPLPTKE